MSAEKPFGVTEWFRPGEHARVEASLDQLDALGARWLRTHLSWADWHAPSGAEWYDWLLPTLAARIEVLPCLHYTPPSLSRTGASSGPPRRPQDLADFADQTLDRYGRHFTHLELWNEPNNILDWDWRADPDWLVFSEMIGAAAHWIEKRGWKAVLGGPCPFDVNWVELMAERGVLDVVSAVSIHGFPGTWESESGVWAGWGPNIAALRAILARRRPDAEVWITEAGYSTWRHDEVEQARSFVAALDAPAERMYWYGLADLPLDTAIQEGLRFDLRHYHMGVLDARGRDKLLARLLRAGGPAAVRRKLRITSAGPRRAAEPVLITGGAGFIGSNLADALLADGHEVIVFDNFSRAGVSRNLDWLRDRHGARVITQAADIRDADAVAAAVEDAAAVFHMAAQVAVTDSLDYPVEDFEVNARGTLNLLEALRAKARPTPLVFASTNKVYGALRDLEMEATSRGYLPMDPGLRGFGVDEARPLDFSTPYGCSKGAADQYVLDYAHSYGLKTAVLRMSCVYGPRQFGTEDQGWVAHFLIRALADTPVTLFGDGRQVRDILHVSDAVRAYRAVLGRIDALRGQAFNLGGGPANAVSLRRMLEAIGALTGRRVRRRLAPERAGDQRYFVADTRRLTEATGWRAETPWRRGLPTLHDWLVAEAGVVAEAAERLREGDRDARGACQSALGV
jgi:CDP-paratose 2-epimerase